MSLADVTFINMCRDVIENGTSTEGEKVRPVWEDGTSAYTIKRFGVVNRYDLRKEFPALTLRRTALKVLWMRYSGSGRKNQITSKIFTVISGTAGPMRMDPLVRHMVISWGETSVQRRDDGSGRPCII